MKHTILTAFDQKGNVVFRSIEPRVMTEREIRRECKKWVVNRNNTIVEYV